MQTHMNTTCTHRGSHPEVKVSGVASNGVNNIAGLLWAPQICLNGNDSEQLNHPRTTHRPGDHNTPQLRQAGKTHDSVGIQWSHQQISPVYYSLWAQVCIEDLVVNIRSLGKDTNSILCILYFLFMELWIALMLCPCHLSALSSPSTPKILRFSVLIYLLLWNFFPRRSVHTYSCCALVIMSRPPDSRTHPHAHIHWRWKAN